MRLSAWGASAPNRDSMAPKVVKVLEPVLDAMGAEADAHCWVAWGDDPAIRYVVLTPTAAGLAVCHVRVNVPQEGPRVGGKLVRWSKLQLPDLAIEAQAGHRLLSFLVEQQIVKGVDEEADRVAEFVHLLFAAIDGRPWPDLDARSKNASGRRAGSDPASDRSRTTSALARTAISKAGPKV
jgi:hypothetical protein